MVAAAAEGSERLLDLAAGFDTRPYRLPLPSEFAWVEADLPALTKGMAHLRNLELLGLMTIPPYFEEPERVRPYFRRLRELRDKTGAQLGLPLTVLSMGMSHDFEIAIEEGATEIRVGTGIFGQRSNKL